MGHTPGPWINSSGYITATDGSEITDVAWSGSDPEGKANARLIAAAPELLAVCRNLLGCLSDWCEKTGAWRSIRPGDDIADDDDQREDDHLAMAAAEVAIAKAEGRSE